MYIGSMWYYKWMFETRLIQYFEQPFFKNCSFLPNILDQLFSFVCRFYAHPFPLYFLEVFRHGDLTIISFESCTHQRDLLQGVLFALTHLYTLCPIIVAHLICVLHSLADDTHIIGLVSDVLPFLCDCRRNLEHQDFSYSRQSVQLGLHKGQINLYHFL